MRGPSGQVSRWVGVGPGALAPPQLLLVALTGRCPSPSEHRGPGTEVGELLGVSVPPVLEDKAEARLDRPEPADFRGGSALPRPHWDKKAWPVSGPPLVLGGLAGPLQP